MTARKSTAKHNYFMTNLINKVNANKRVSIVILILYLLCVPLILVNYIIHTVTYQNYEKALDIASAAAGVTGNVDYDKLPAYYEFNEAYLVIAVIALLLAILAGVVIAMSNYSYLHKKTQVDMIYSLPMTTTQRFFSDYLSGLISYVGPFLASSVVTLILCCIGRATCNDWMNTDVIYNSIETFGYQSVGQVIFQASLYGIFVLIMTYTICVLVISCCGSFLEAGAYIFVTNGLIPASIAVAGFLFIGDLYGIDVESNVLPSIEITNPLGAFVKVFEAIEYSSPEICTMWNLMLTWLLPFALVTAAYLGLAYVLYRKRKAEDVSKPFVFKLFYYIVSTAITFCIAVLFMGDEFETGPVPMIITSAIIFFIMEAIANRGFRKFWKSIIRFAVTITCLILAMNLVDVTNGFGMVYYLPSASTVSSVEISYDGIRVCDSSFSVTGSDKGIVLHDKESIQAVIDVQSANLERYRTSGRSNGITDLNIKYKTAFGREIVRRYYVDINEYDMLSGIDRTDEFIDDIVDIAMGNQLENRYYNENAYSVANIVKKNESFSIMVDRTNYTSEIEMLANAIKTDLKNISDDEYYKPTAECYGYLDFGNYEVPLSNNYPSVLAFVKNKGFECNVDYTNIDANSVTIGKFDEDGNCYSKDTMIYIDKSLGISNSDMMKLLKAAQRKYQITNESYYIIIDGNYYVVPDECTGLVNNIYSYLIENMYVNGNIVDEYSNVYYFNSFEGIDAIIETIFSDKNNDVVNWNVFSSDNYNTSSGKAFVESYIDSKISKCYDERYASEEIDY